MNPRIRSRIPASIGSNQTSPVNKIVACAVVLSSFMAWSPPARQRRSWLVEQAGDYATFQFHHLRDGTRLRGPQHSCAWCDELGAWRYPESWPMLLFGLRLGTDPRV